jgi:hypothetical protein
MSADIEGFARSWTYVRDMTTAFIQAVPERCWEIRLNERYGPLNKQFRHMVGIYGAYLFALKTGSLDMAQKHRLYSGSLRRDDILAALNQRDGELRELLKDPKLRTPKYSVDFWGTSMSFNEFTHVMLQHEALHHGIWTGYAAAADFALPESWQNDWSL